MLRKHYRYLYIFKKICFGVAGIIGMFLFVHYYIFDQHSSGNVFFAIDLSNSMNVQDVTFETSKGKTTISRLDATKRLIMQTISGDKKQEKKYGLVLFTTTGEIFVPPTQDYAFLLSRLSLLHTNQIPGGEAKINTIQKLLSSILQYEDLLFIFTDGEDIRDNQNGSGKIKAKIHTIGVGTPKGGIVRYANGSALSSEGKTQYSSLDIQGLYTIHRHRGGQKRIYSSLTEETKLSLSTPWYKGGKHNTFLSVFALFLLIGMG